MVPSCNGKPSGVYLDQNRPNCQFFYTCRDQRVFNHTRCPGAMRFNQFEGRCQPAQYVKCALSSSTSLSVSNSPTRYLTSLLLLLLPALSTRSRHSLLALLLLSIFIIYYFYQFYFLFHSLTTTTTSLTFLTSVSTIFIIK
jgi:hypothetical protein